MEEKHKSVSLGEKISSSAFNDLFLIWIEKLENR
jgi:hypothetical protein